MKHPSLISIPCGTASGAFMPMLDARSVATPRPAPPVARKELEARLKPSIGAARGYGLHDWLDLHGLTARQCESLLHRTCISASGPSPDGRRSRTCDLSGDQAWQLAAAALLARFPQAAELIKAVGDKTVRVFHPDRARLSRPFTIQADGCPMVVLSYRGRFVDLLTLAHEFGHAVQVVAGGHSFVPPVNREICAFVAELALLKLLEAEFPVLHSFALSAWEAANRNYLGRDGRVLALALRDSQARYDYSWNYPVARLLASQCSEHLPNSALWSIFENRIPLSGIVSFLDCSQRNSRSCTGACLSLAR